MYVMKADALIVNENSKRVSKTDSRRLVIAADR
jgi:hypothetical protein